MKKKIENLAQLREEIRRLEAKSDALKSQLQDDFSEIKENLKPANLLIETISDLIGFSINRDAFSKNGFAGGIRFIAEGIISKAGAKIEERANAIVEKVFNHLSHFVENIFVRGTKSDPEED